MVSRGFRFLMVGGLTMLMGLPLLYVAGIIGERADYNRQTIRQLGQEWGGPQMIVGPQLVIPVEGSGVREATREVRDDQGNMRAEKVEVVEVVRKAPIYLYPDQFDVAVNSSSEQRARGIFSVPVFLVEAKISATFDMEAAAKLVAGEDKILWDEAELRVALSNNKALRGKVALSAGSRAFDLEPMGGDAPGLMAALGDPRKFGAFSLILGVNGSDWLRIAPVGRTTTVEMISDWPHPSFTGTFLPTRRKATEDGFQASWEIPHVARSLQQLSRRDQLNSAKTAGFGVQFFQPNDFYQKAYRAARYGLLFVALTFLTVLLLEDRKGRGTHPVQYIFIGLAQSVFLLLMVAYAEQIGFLAAYVFSAAAVTGLIAGYGYWGLKLGVRALLLGATLIAFCI